MLSAVIVIAYSHVIAVVCTCALCLHKFVAFFAFCPTQTLLRARDGEYKAIHCEDRLSGAEVDPWLACHGYLLPITSFAVWKLPSTEVLTA